MAYDPKMGRISAQTREFGSEDLPPGKVARGWRYLEGSVDDKAWQRLLAAELTPAEQDELHEEAWIAAGGELD